MILQTRREYRKPLWVAYVDFCFAFDSSSNMAAVEILGVSQQIVELLEDLYSNTINRVRLDGVMSDWFEMSAGVR